MLRRREGGQALVEFALVAPIFFLILFGIIQAGLLFGGQNALTNAVRETARYAAPYRVVDAAGASTTCPTVADSLTAVLGAGAFTADPARTTELITYTWKQDVNNLWYVSVTVKVTYRFPLYVPLVSNVLDGLDGVADQSLKLTAQEEMRVENDPLASSSSTTSCS